MEKPSFKPFDKVLVRDDSAGDGWRASFFSHYRDGHPVTINGWEFDRMIPFEGNEHLVGTKDMPEPELKKGDTVLVWKKGDIAKAIRVYSYYDCDFNQHMTYGFLLKNGSATELQSWDYAEKFAPASVETALS